MKPINYGIWQLLLFTLLTQPRACTFLMVTVSTTVCAAGAFLLDMIGAKAANKASAGAEKMERVSNALDCLAGFLARIPDELELTHRSVCCCSRNETPYYITYCNTGTRTGILLPLLWSTPRVRRCKMLLLVLRSAHDKHNKSHIGLSRAVHIIDNH